MNDGKGSLEETPTWAVSIICLVFFLLSLAIDAGLRHLTQFLRRKKRKSLNRALQKIKTEMMIMGFISLLLTILEVPISKICVTKAMADSFLPCEDPLESTDPGVEIENESYCEAKGMVSLVSREGIMQLRIFIFALAAFHILYCVSTMFLGSAKMRKWKAWEEETRTLEYEIANDPMRFQFAHQTSFGRRHLKLWSDYPLLLWPVCLVRQFRGSISKADYFTLRNGFIKANCAAGSDFNFQEFLARAFDDDFEQVVGISFWIWIFSILFLFFSAHGFYNHYWLPFIPLVIVLVVGAKLGVIISEMCMESHNKNSVIRGTFLVKPSDDFFWFGRPKWLLHLLQLILFQNSFQLAFFTWTWYEYGLRSCFNRETEDIALRIAMALFVQFLCGYVTLPLYALVTQMGSGMKTAIFTESVAMALKHWRNIARRQSLSSAVMRSPSSPAETRFSSFEINEEEATHPKIVTRGSYDGEISFGSSWKQVERGKGIGAITSIIEENASIIVNDDFNR